MATTQVTYGTDPVGLRTEITTVTSPTTGIQTVTTRVLNADGTQNRVTTETRDPRVMSTTNTTTTWGPMSTTCVVLGVLVILLIIVVIILAVYLAKCNSEEGGHPNPNVPNPAPAQLAGFTDFTVQGWPCATRYRALFAGNSHWSTPSLWTDEMGPVQRNDPVANSHPSIRVPNAPGQTVTFQRQIRAPVDPSRRRAPESNWAMITMASTGDPAVFIDVSNPCEGFPLPPTPEPVEPPGTFSNPEDVWGQTSYKIAYTDRPTEWSLWSDFVCSSEADPGTNPVIYAQIPLEKRNWALIWHRRTNVQDEDGTDVTTFMQATANPREFIDTKPSPPPVLLRGR